MSQQRALQLLQEAAAALQNADTSTSSPPVSTHAIASTSTPISTRVSPAAAVRSIFQPYSGASLNRKGYRSFGRQASGGPAPPRTFWTHTFCVLGNISDVMAPNRQERDRLYKANLGERKISFQKNDSASYFKSHLEEQYPKLVGIGGFELLRTHATRRSELEVLRMPPGGYTVNFIANVSNLAQAVCYIRPIQRNISLEEDDLSDDGGVQEECIRCHEQIPLRFLREHAQACGTSETDKVIFILFYFCKSILHLYQFYNQK